MPAKLEMVQLQEGKENHTRHPPEGNAHAHTKLSCRQIHFSNPFSDWMLHLKTWVELQEVKVTSLHAVEIFYSCSTNVIDALGEPTSPLL
jgi:hypothetical protein